MTTSAAPCESLPSGAGAFEIGRRYTRREIREGVGGGGLYTYLPHKGERVFCGCFRLDYNPKAPGIVLPGPGPRIVRAAELFVAQDAAVPIFLKRAVNEWEYVGRYRPRRPDPLCHDRAMIAREAAGRTKGRTDGSDVWGVLYLEPA